MKSYRVITWRGNRPFTMLSSFDDLKFLDTYETDDLEEAKELFKKEVQALEDRFTHVDKLPYDPTDSEVDSCGFHTELIMEDDEDDTLIETIELSDYYFKN